MPSGRMGFCPCEAEVVLVRTGRGIGPSSLVGSYPSPESTRWCLIPLDAPCEGACRSCFVAADSARGIEPKFLHTSRDEHDVGIQWLPTGLWRQGHEDGLVGISKNGGQVAAGFREQHVCLLHHLLERIVRYPQ